MIHQNPLDSARIELQALLAQRAEIDRRIAAVQETIKILEPVYGSGGYETLGKSLTLAQLFAVGAEDAGLTDRIRDFLRISYPEAFAPRAIRDSILQAGFDASNRSNFLAEIHNVLKRLVAQGDAEEVHPLTDGTNVAYRATKSAAEMIGRYRPAIRATAPPPDPPPGFDLPDSGAPSKKVGIRHQGRTYYGEVEPKKESKK